MPGNLQTMRAAPPKKKQRLEARAQGGGCSQGEEEVNPGSNKGVVPSHKEVERCKNMAVQLREGAHLVVGPSKVAGWGAFTVNGFVPPTYSMAPFDAEPFSIDSHQWCLGHLLLSSHLAHSRGMQG